MMDIKNPIFVIVDDGSVLFLNEPWGFEDILGMEPIDVANGLYTAYDSEGQVLKMVTINDETGEIERPTEHKIKIPFFKEIVVGIDFDRSIKAIPQGIKEPDRLMDYLVNDLSALGHNVEGCSLSDLVKIYQNKFPNLLEEL